MIYTVAWRDVVSSKSSSLSSVLCLQRKVSPGQDCALRIRYPLKNRIRIFLRIWFGSDDSEAGSATLVLEGDGSATLVQEGDPQLWSRRGTDPQLWSRRGTDPQLWSRRGTDPQLWSRRGMIGELILQLHAHLADNEIFYSIRPNHISSTKGYSAPRIILLSRMQYIV